MNFNLLLFYYWLVMIFSGIFWKDFLYDYKCFLYTVKVKIDWIIKSAYIRLSTETEVIGTYSINEIGDNIGLLIGCFSKNISKTSNTLYKWYFKPLNKVNPGHIVTQSVSSIQKIFHSIFDNKIEIEDSQW